MKWFQYARRLSNVRRCGTLRMLHPQNVAEHSYYAAILGIKMLGDLKTKGYEINESEILQKILAHDLEESLTGDMPYPYKRSSKKMAEAMTEVRDTLVREFYPEWLAQKNIEAKSGEYYPIVVAVDYLELYAYCLEERWLGNRDPYLDEILEECRKIVKRQAESKGLIESDVGALALSYMSEIELSHFRPENTLNERMMASD